MFTKHFMIAVNIEKEYEFLSEEIITFTNALDTVDDFIVLIETKKSTLDARTAGRIIEGHLGIIMPILETIKNHNLDARFMHVKTLIEQITQAFIDLEKIILKNKSDSSIDSIIENIRGFNSRLRNELAIFNNTISELRKAA